jgi:AcrR family transcriptional regulator
MPPVRRPSDAARPSRSYDPGQTRKSIIKAGLKLFKKSGFASTAVKDIAEQAGVTKGAFYHHFETKEDLLLLPDQGVVFGGKAYRIGDLVDGIAIRREEAPANFSAIEILLEGHAGILVQGLALEVGLPDPASLGGLKRVAIDDAIASHLAIAAAEIALEAAAEGEPSDPTPPKPLG